MPDGSDKYKKASVYLSNLRSLLLSGLHPQLYYFFVQIVSERMPSFSVNVRFFVRHPIDKSFSICTWFLQARQVLQLYPLTSFLLYTAHVLFLPFHSDFAPFGHLLSVKYLLLNFFLLKK